MTVSNGRPTHERNAANPRIGSGMQQARDSVDLMKHNAKARFGEVQGGGNRRGGAKPRGRNESDGVRPIARIGGTQVHPREWTPESRSMEGEGVA